MTRKWSKNQNLNIPILLTAINKFRSTDRKSEEPRNDKKHSFIQKETEFEYSNFSHSYPQISTIDRYRKKNWKTMKWQDAFIMKQTSTIPILLKTQLFTNFHDEQTEEIKKIKRSIRWFKKSSTIPILLTAIHKFPRSTERRTEKPRNDKKHSQRRNRPRLFQFSSKTPILQISIRIRRWKGKKREGKTARNANGSELITRWSGVIPRWIAESSNVPVAVTCGQASA